MPSKRQTDDAFFAGPGPARPKSSGPRGPPSGKPRPQTKPSHKPQGKPSPNGSNKTSDKAKAAAKPAPDALILANQPLTAAPSLDGFAALRRLDLSNTGLTSIGFVKQAKNTLTWLNVSGNPLDSVDAWDGVHELGGLYVLTASNCGLTEVPSVVEVLHSLKALVITHNKLTALNHVKRLVQLNTIVVSNNALTSLPASLSTLPALKKISAAHNQLSPSSLPDLSSLPNLREVRLSHNPALTSLPPHFASWGKGEDHLGRRSAGLDIVDLSSCGFEDWVGLGALAGQAGVHNLSLVGNKVADEAKEDGFEEFKSKMSILLPALRILDNHRFDPKHADLKARRLARTDEQRIIEAGPMMLAINSKQEAPVKIPKALLQEKEVLKRNKKRLEGVVRAEEKAYRRACREAVKEGRDPEEVPKPRSLVAKEEESESGGEEKEGGMEVDEAGARAGAGAKEAETKVEAEAEAPAVVVPLTAEEEAAALAAAQEKKKEKRRRKREAAALEAEGGVEADPSMAGDKARKKAKKDHKDRDHRKEDLDEDEIARLVEQRAADILAGKVQPKMKKVKAPRKVEAGAEGGAKADAVEVEAVAEVQRHKKRGRDGKKHPELVAGPRKEREASPPRPKKKKGGLLADLRGDPNAPAQAKEVAKAEGEADAASAPGAGAEGAEGEAPAPAKESKAKTSVLKVVEVKRKKGGEAPVVDVSSLLGLGGGAQEAEVAVGSGWD